MAKTLIMIAIALSLIACDCVLGADGVILDADTNIPVAEVLISRDENLQREVFQSDSSGHFDFFDIDGGWKCPDLRLYFAKEGYEMLEKDYGRNNTKNDTIYLKRK